MTRDRRGFHYPLEPVRQLTEWEISDIARALAQANVAADTQQACVNDLSRRFSEARSEVLVQRQAKASLDIQAQRLAHAYMVQVQRQLVAENEKLLSMQRERDEIFERLNVARRFADSLDRNKEEEGEEYDQQVAKQAYRQADDSWLQRLHWSTNHD